MITADIMTWEPEAGEEPFDFLFDDRLVMLLPDSDWPEVARRYSRWLQPQGVCLVHTINFGGTMGQDVSATRTPFEDAFNAAGFREKQKLRLTPDADMSEPERIIFYIHGSG